MDTPRIQDIPSISKTLQQFRTLKALSTIYPVLKPAMRMLGINVQQIDTAFTQADFDKLLLDVEELATIPDRFNDLFAARGWIIYDLMNLEAAKSAVYKGEAGDLDGAEEDLVAHYNPDTVAWLLMMMRGVNAFRARLPLAERALVDYREGRYHACVPVVLALLDGMVNEASRNRRGFFAQEADLEAWDSVAAHNKGLNTLRKILQTGRYKTTTDPLSIPYRNGILHGADLGYDNIIVAAKAWGALFAARDWAVKAEEGQLDAPPEMPKTSLGDLLRQIRQYSKDKADNDARLKTWAARSIVPGKDFPASGTPEEYNTGTPERALAEFLAFWKSANYGRMVTCVATMHAAYLGDTPKKAAGEMRELFGPKKLKAFEFLGVVDKAPALAAITTRVVFEQSEQVMDRVIEFHLLNEDTKGDPAIRGKPNTGWKLVSYYV